ncbi:MAG TPA: nuclear transport factor 2 family protein [Pseudomonas sp.]|nr:nuclear transport factor 2 family protein [Pseudomonas sp.]
MNRNSDEVRNSALKAFLSYTRAFQKLDPRAVAPYFHEPAFHVTADGARMLPDAPAVEQMYQQVMADLPARGYVRTDFSGLEAHCLSDNLAQVSGTGEWKTGANETLMRFGMTYTLRRSAGSWRIVVGLIHDPLPG